MVEYAPELGVEFDVSVETYKKEPPENAGEDYQDVVVRKITFSLPVRKETYKCALTLGAPYICEDCQLYVNPTSSSLAAKYCLPM